MSNWFNPRTRARFILPLSASLLLASYAAGSMATCDDSLALSIRVMHALYQELQGKGVTIEIGAEQPFDADAPASTFNVRVSEERPSEPITAAPYPSHLSSAERVGHLSLHFEFDPRYNRLSTMFASGSFVSSDKQQELTKLIEAHPSWSEAQMTDALAVAGAKYGPNQKNALVARFPASQLEPILGKIEIHSAQFEFRSNKQPLRNTVMEWSVRFRASNADQNHEYFASMEPFEGRIVMLGYTPFAPTKSRD